MLCTTYSSASYALSYENYINLLSQRDKTSMLVIDSHHDAIASTLAVAFKHVESSHGARIVCFSQSTHLGISDIRKAIEIGSISISRNNMSSVTAADAAFIGLKIMNPCKE